MQTRTISRMFLLVAILAPLSWAAVARAQDAAPAPAGPRSLAPTPFQLTLPSAHLLGDWYGLRPWLEGYGITPTLTFVTDALGNPVGGRQQGFTGAHNLGLDLLFDLEKLSGPQGGSFLFSMSERFGTSLSAQDIGNVFTVQQVFGGETYRVVNLAYQQTLLDDRVAFRIGRIAAGDDFLVSPYNYVFVQNGFDGNPVGIFFNAPGMTAYPNATWGARVKVRPTARTYVMGGVYNGDPSIRANTHHGVDFSLDGPLFAIVEVGYQRNGLPGDTGLLGNYKAGLWYDHSRFPDFTTAGRGQAPHLTRGNWGFYGLFDQVLVRFGEPGSNRGFGGTGCLRRHQLGGELRRDRHVPPIVKRRRSRRRIRALRHGRRAVPALRVGCCARDKRQDAGTNVGGHDERVSFTGALRSRKQARAVDDQNGMKGT